MPSDPIAEMASDFARAAVDLARDFGAELDYSEDSLKEVERILGRLHDEMHADSHPIEPKEGSPGTPRNAAVRSLDAPRVSNDCNTERRCPASTGRFWPN